MRRGPLFVEAGDSSGGGGGGTLFGGGGAAAPPVTGQGQASPPSNPWFKDDGSFTDDWTTKLTGKHKDSPSLKAIRTPHDLADAYVETKGLVGRKFEAPGSDATPEQVAHWRKTVGAPEEPEGYLGDGKKSFRPDGLTEDAWDAATESQFLAIAHKHHLPAQAVREMMEFYGGSVAKGLQQNMAASEAMLQTEGAKLRQTWGQEYNQNLADAARMSKMAGLDPATDPIFTNAAAVQAFAKLAKQFGESAIVAGGPASAVGGIQARVADITNPQSQSVAAREYRGEFGPERQRNAQAQLHALYEAQKVK